MQNSGVAMEQDYKSSGFVHSVYDESPYGIIVFNADLEVIDWNPAVEKLVGLSKNDCIGRNVLHAFDKTIAHLEADSISNNTRGTLVIAESLSSKFLSGHIGCVKISTIVDKSGAMSGGTLIITAHSAL